MWRQFGNFGVWSSRRWLVVMQFKDRNFVSVGTRVKSVRVASKQVSAKEVMEVYKSVQRR